MWTDPRVTVTITRDPRDADIVHWELAKTWWTGKVSATDERRRHHVIVDEGTFVYRARVEDVRVLIKEVGSRLHVIATAADAGTRAPGRERSGVENIPLPLDLQQPGSPADTATQDADPGE